MQPPYPETMTQEAPFPVALADLVDRFEYRPGWVFFLNDMVRDKAPNGSPLTKGLTLDIVTQGFNSYHRPKIGPHEFGPAEGTVCECGETFPCSSYAVYDDPAAPRTPYRVHHYFPVPPATYNEMSWRYWLLQCCVLVEQHEACEHFDIDGERTFAPNHGPGWNPYIITVETTELDRRTRFTGEVLEAK